MNLTEHFTLEEFIRSLKAKVMSIDNTMPEHLMLSAVRTCEGLERIRSIFGMPIVLISGYRCEELNREVGGSKTSQHMKAEAGDILCPAYGIPHDVAKAIIDNMKFVRFDQLIKEKNWVHVSFSLQPRYEILTLTKDGYLPGLV